MNKNKMSFIYCVNNEVLFSESVLYLEQLEVPEGFEVEVIPIRGANSITEGYNRGMAESDAKYKVYLHQDVLIINKSFIHDVVRIFNQNPQLGLLGMVGAGQMPTNGIWWEAAGNCYGKVFESHTGKMELLSFQEVQHDYECVQAVDGLILITQYDIPWREDLFTGWHFYDASQCAEFIRAGYQAGVPKQEAPWCMHDCGIVNVKNGYEKYRKVFLSEYAKDLYPLVSVLIPTYNRPAFFEQALLSVLNQTYKHIEIIISDNSTNDETNLIVQKYLNHFRNIRYYKNRTNLGFLRNITKCYELAEGEYVNYLMDDDLFHSHKIERMMNYYLFNQHNITLVTSHRQLIDENGNPLPEMSYNRKLFEKDAIVDGIELGNFNLSQLTNFIGEPTTVLFRKKDLKEPYSYFSGRPYICNVDMASWINLLASGNAVYISDTLSYFRLHTEQMSKKIKTFILGAIDFAHQILECRKLGFFKDDEQYRTTVTKYLTHFNYLIETVPINVRDTDEYQELLHYKKLLQDKLATMK